MRFNIRYNDQIKKKIYKYNIEALFNKYWIIKDAVYML
jgi:hypothetical protein